MRQYSIGKEHYMVLMKNKKMDWSRGELKNLSDCPACGQEFNSAPLHERQDDENLMPEKWQIYQCKRCTSTFVNPQPEERSLTSLYQDYLTHKPTSSDPVFVHQNLVWRLIRGYLQKRFSLCTEQPFLKLGYYIFMALPPLRNKLDRYGRNLNSKRFKSKGKLLDFGCGAGEFLKISDKMGWKTYGCDFDPVVVNSCRTMGFDVRLGDLTAFNSREKFDVITMNQVIEHVTNPQQTIKDCFARLNKNGCLWIGTPNPNAYGATAFGAAWAGWHPPYHLCLPSQSELVRWMQEAGFSHIRVLQRGPHAKFNWNASNQLAKKHGIKIKPMRKLYFYFADLMNCITPSKGEETVIIGYKK